MRQWRIRNKPTEVEKAHGRTRAYSNVLQKRGALIRQPCEVARGCEGPVEKHHPDYSNPRRVRWLCRKHHKALHVMAKRFERNVKALLGGRT